MFKKILLSATLFFSFLTPSFSQESTVSVGVGLLTPPESFEKLGIKEEDLGRYIKQIVAVVDEGKIIKTSKDGLLFLVEITGIKNKPETCKKDYKKCVMMKLVSEFSDTISKEDQKIVSDNFMKIDEVQVKNNNSKEKAVFYIFIGKSNSENEDVPGSCKTDLTA